MLKVIKDQNGMEYQMIRNVNIQIHYLECYFLMMTFPSTTKKNVLEALEDLKKIFI